MYNRNVPTEPGIACSQNTVSTTINKFIDLPSILSINKNMERIECPSFPFEFVSLKETIKEVNKLSIKKSFPNTRYIAAKIIKESKDLNDFNDLV